MRRSKIDVGRPHQNKVATWARQRLVDTNGSAFTSGKSTAHQTGVILADGVGLGKTWEALAASALFLVERGRQTSSGRARTNQRRQAARILVLCPPGLVSKWAREICDKEGFISYLHTWAKRRKARGFVVKTLTDPYEIRRRGDLPAATVQRSHMTFPMGTYICNWSVFGRKAGKGRTRLAALRSQKWDVIIVDEAHHRAARVAIDAISRKENTPVLLLTATPFQLQPRELHDIVGAIVDKRHRANRILSREPVKSFVSDLDKFFRTEAPPRLAIKRDAEKTLRQLLARSRVPTKGRRYHLLSIDGSASPIDSPDSLGERALKRLLDSRGPSDLARAPHVSNFQLIDPSEAFEEWYLNRRLGLATSSKLRTFLPNALRQALSTPQQARSSSGSLSAPPEAPRLVALGKWARLQAIKDLRRTAVDGHPRKILVFTSFVSKAADEIQTVLTQSIDQAWRTVSKEDDWRNMAQRARSGLLSVKKKLEYVISSDSELNRRRECIDLVASLDVLIDTPCICRDLFGNRIFRSLVMRDLQRRLSTLVSISDGEIKTVWSARRSKEGRREVQIATNAIRAADSVRTYVGYDDLKEREAAGEAFRSPFSPWALVASNVGSEGIDLHTHCSHLVHFDIEWNPARMEQREGRSDRIGRLLDEPINVYFTLVRGTYDERMLHQLIARQRWHSVLLGKSAAQLAQDTEGKLNVKLADLRSIAKITLNLQPG